MQKAYRDLFSSVRERPGMWLIATTANRYDVTVAFVTGCDIANAGGLLRGFEEWLLQRHGGASNVMWWRLVLNVAFPRSPHCQVAELSYDQNRHAVAVLWDLLDRFLADSESRVKTRDIYVGFQRWKDDPEHKLVL
jgi:hypothetical protein